MSSSTFSTLSVNKTTSVAALPSPIMIVDSKNAISEITSSSEDDIMAFLAYQTERYEDMRQYCLRFSNYDSEMTTQQRNLFGISFKNTVFPLRTSLSTIHKTSTQLLSSNNENNSLQKKWVDAYEGKITKEIVKLCNEVLDVIENRILPMTEDIESKLFFQKMKADYLRYLFDIKTSTIIIDHPPPQF